MNFGLWRSIGKEFLIKSNINNWIACKEGSGSIVQQRVGSITCKLVKLVSDQCSGVVPNSVGSNSIGMYISSGNTYYYFEGDTKESWLSHDPCGKGEGTYVKCVANPHGNIFIR